MRRSRLDPVEGDLTGVLQWRRGRLEKAGFPPALAGEVAEDRRFDVHALLGLVEQGCPPALAARILAPLEGPEGTRR